MIRGQSRLEAQHVRDTEFDRDVLGVVEQPMRLRLPDGTDYLPDAFVWTRTGSYEIREVKYEDEARRLEERWKLIGEFLRRHGFHYRVVTEIRLRHPPRAANLVLLMASRHVEVPPDDFLDMVWREFRSVRFTVADLTDRFPAIGVRQFHALIRLGFLALVDLDEPIGPGSELELFRRRITRVASAFRDGPVTLRATAIRSRSEEDDPV